MRNIIKSILLALLVLLSPNFIHASKLAKIAKKSVSFFKLQSLNLSQTFPSIFTTLRDVVLNKLCLNFHIIT